MSHSKANLQTKKNGLKNNKMVKVYRKMYLLSNVFATFEKNGLENNKMVHTYEGTCISYPMFSPRSQKNGLEKNKMVHRKMCFLTNVFAGFSWVGLALD